MKQLLIKLRNVLNSGRKYLSRLATLWHDLGLDDTQRQPRRDEFEKHLSKVLIDLLSAMVEEEEKAKQKVIADVAEFKIKIDDLCNEMKRSCEMVSVQAYISLLLFVNTSCSLVKTCP